jgi:hypothetical protein
MERFNLKNLNDQVKITNIFTALENLNDTVDINKVWESIRENIKLHLNTD